MDLDESQESIRSNPQPGVLGDVLTQILATKVQIMERDFGLQDSKKGIKPVLESTPVAVQNPIKAEVRAAPEMSASSTTTPDQSKLSNDKNSWNAFKRDPTAKKLFRQLEQLYPAATILDYQKLSGESLHARLKEDIGVMKQFHFFQKECKTMDKILVFDDYFDDEENPGCKRPFLTLDLEGLSEDFDIWKKRWKALGTTKLQV